MENNAIVNMEHVIGQWAIDYGVPYLAYEALVLLAQRAINVYGLQQYAKQITFADLCEYIVCFVKTPFGAKMLRELSLR